MRAVALSVVVSCLASFGFIVNDLWDRDVDRINKPGHLENASPITLRLGMAAGIGFLITGLGLAYWLGSLESQIACGIALALVAYTVLLRRFLFIPTVVAAVLAASPVWAPLVIWGGNVDTSRYIFLAAVIVIAAARETIMDAGDRVGDFAGGRDTLATVFGGRIAKFVGVMLTASAVILFVITVASSALNLPTVSKLGVLGVVGTMSYLLVYPAVKALLDTQDDTIAIQNYIRRSRAAMALLPVLNLILWRA